MSEEVIEIDDKDLPRDGSASRLSAAQLAKLNAGCYSLRIIAKPGAFCLERLRAKSVVIEGGEKHTICNCACESFISDAGQKVSLINSRVGLAEVAAQHVRVDMTAGRMQLHAPQTTDLSLHQACVTLCRGMPELADLYGTDVTGFARDSNYTKIDDLYIAPLLHPCRTENALLAFNAATKRIVSSGVNMPLPQTADQALEMSKALVSRVQYVFRSEAETIATGFLYSMMFAQGCSNGACDLRG